MSLNFYTLLAASLDSDEARRSFLSGRRPLGCAQTQTPPTPALHSPSADPSLPSAAGLVKLTSEEIETGARRLAKHLGPIASILARKAAQKAPDLRAFYTLLADYLGPDARAVFLREGGFEG